MIRTANIPPQANHRDDHALDHISIPCRADCDAGGEFLGHSRTTPQLKVSDNHRFLVTAAGRPFFYLGDTAWELFHRLNREEAETYLKNRAERRFTVIQAVALAELDGLSDRAPNPYGQVPLIKKDPAQPNDEYFQHVDWIVAKANSLGMYVGFLPTWGNNWNRSTNANFTPQNAEVYTLPNPHLLSHQPKHLLKQSLSRQRSLRHSRSHQHRRFHSR